MKLFIATDIHGSSFWANKLVEKFKKSKADQMILLGDIYNHGPRNPFPEGYAPVKVASVLNSVADKIVAVRGNCDSEVDQTISEFPFFLGEYALTTNDRRMYFTHGHKQNKGNFPMTIRKGDVVFYGHFHISDIARVNGVTCVNVGSVALPKDGKYAYCIATDKNVTVYDLVNDSVIVTADYNVNNAPVRPK